MRKIDLLARVIVIVISSCICAKASAQTNHSEVFTFMINNGWHLSPEIKFSSSRSVNCDEFQYYNFDSGHKYAIVAFTGSKDVKDLTLQALYKNGDVYSKNYDTKLLPKYFNLNDCAIFMFFPGENVNLGVKLISSKLSHYCSECHYMIFYK